MLRNKRRIEALEIVVDGIIELLVKKGKITRSELQQQIMDDAESGYVERGGIIYKVTKEEAENDEQA